MTSPPFDDAEGRRFRIVALAVIGVVVLVGAIGLVLLHLFRPDASATFIVQVTALVTGVATVAVTIWGIGRLAKNQAVIREQVQNSHATPLRDDLDGKHDTLAAGQRAILTAIQDIRRDIGGIRQDARDDRNAVRHLTDRFDDHLKEHP